MRYGNLSHRIFLPVLAGLALLPTARGDEKQPYTNPACLVDDFFTEQVWTKVLAKSCLNCHEAGGDAEDSEFVLQDPKLNQSLEQEGTLQQNREVFAKIAQIKEEGDQSRLLLKV